MPTVNAFTALNSPSAATPPRTQNEVASEDRFLKLLVAQMSNQDPLNPLDNAQVTSQMAQISTVSGLDKLNKTVEGLNRQFVQMQALQGASLVGRDVILPGDRLAPNDAGLVQGGFELAAPADSVRIEVLNAGGHVIDTINLGAEGAGRHGFEWTPPAGVDETADFAPRRGRCGRPDVDRHRRLDQDDQTHQERAPRRDAQRTGDQHHAHRSAWSTT